MYDNSGNYFRVQSATGQYLDQSGNPNSKQRSAYWSKQDDPDWRSCRCEEWVDALQQYRSYKAIGTSSMKMQESTISLIADAGVANGAGVFRLSGLSSEWLFSTRFWQELNARMGTMFDQYEEDEVGVTVAAAVVEALELRLQLLRMSSTSTVEFVYGWSLSQEPLTATIEKRDLLSELVGLHGFLCEAIATNRSLYFSL